MTPLASIIGSGFLVLGPILAHSYGMWATAVMAALCLMAWGFGVVMRDNIRYAEAVSSREDRMFGLLSRLSDLALAGAYVVSVAYYLNLFGAFGIRLTPFEAPWAARALTSAMLLLLLWIGWTRGFGALEKAEIVTVAVKLSVIAGLLAGLFLFTGDRAMEGTLILNPVTVPPLAGLTLFLGLIVTVQGFETSRYLGAAYDAATRIRSMRLAQILATVIYVAYVGLLSFGLPVPQAALSETAIIDLMRTVSPLLPPLLVLAALAAQSSAALADAGGAGGLVAGLSRGLVSERVGYLVLVLAGLALTWGSDVFSIISYASRVFALYYAIQSAIALRLALRRGAGAAAVLYAAMALLGLLAAAFGTPVEGNA